MAKNFTGEGIEGVYSADPAKDPSAIKYDTISLEEVFAKKLKVIDTSATVVCMENKMPLLIFKLNRPNGIYENATGTCTGTIVTA